MRKTVEFRDMSNEELDATYQDLLKEVYHLRNEFKQSRKLEKPHLIPQKKKEIARLLTVKHEKQLAKKKSQV